jgi:hypothetical protein
VSSPVDIEPPLPARLRALAGDVARLTPSRTDPERYHIAKSEIVEGCDARRVRLTLAIPPAPERERYQELTEARRPPAADCRHCRRRLADQAGGSQSAASRCLPSIIYASD